MPVKSSHSGARILMALERIAEHQPLGPSELARHLDTNIAAAQRAIATLAEEGWIRPAAGTRARWELTAHIHTVARYNSGLHDLRLRARGALEQLMKDTGESVLLNVPDGRNFIVIDVFESPNYLRMSPPIGLVIPAPNSATARALLPYFTPGEQSEFLGGPPDEELQASLALTISRGYSVSEGDVVTGSTNLAAPIFEWDGRPVAAVLISAPSDRASEADCKRLGGLVAATARSLSRGKPPA